MILKLNKYIWLLVLQIMLISPAVLRANQQMHTVKKGDTLYSLSKQYDTTVDQLMKLNSLQGNNLYIGQKLIIKAETEVVKPKPAVPVKVVTPDPIPDKDPPPVLTTIPIPVPPAQLGAEYFYTVKAKDNLYRISLDHGIVLADMLAWNGFASSNVPIHPGDRIIVKDPTGATATELATPEVGVLTAPQLIATVQDTVVVERVYVVQKKDTLYRIATSNGMTVDELKKLNNLTGNELRVGQRIYLAGKKRPDGSISPTNVLTEEDVQRRDKIRTDLIMPVEGRVISEFGLRNGHPHKGVDLGAKQGTPIYAVMDGTVVYSGVQGAYGNVVVIEHPDFVMTVYAHNEKNMVSVNDVVKKGQQIATVGATGNAQGAHLHFEYRLKGKALNPRKVLPLN
jgi:murein DD-endopeptidase MepM/ murein hydrolase activator NlpD